MHFLVAYSFLYKISNMTFFSFWWKFYTASCSWASLTLHMDEMKVHFVSTEHCIFLFLLSLLFLLSHRAVLCEHILFLFYWSVTVIAYYKRLVCIMVFNGDLLKAWDVSEKTWNWWRETRICAHFIYHSVINVVQLKLMRRGGQIATGIPQTCSVTCPPTPPLTQR